MTDFQVVCFDPDLCLRETKELQALLASRASLDERADILPFFKARLQLSAFLGSYHPDIARFDLVAHEFSLFGDFVCDVVVGDTKTRAFIFIEFEDAARHSIFKARKSKGRSTPEWATRFERGFSQVVDWFYKLHDQSNTTAFEEKFGARSIQYQGLLVIGRNEPMGPREKQRLLWRQEHVTVYSKQVHCKTFDQVCENLLHRLQRFPTAVQAEPAENSPKGTEPASPEKRQEQP
jgi:hypothetical protein